MAGEKPVAINGAGLAGSLLFLLLKERGVEAELYDRQVEPGSRTWCFHGSDMPPALWDLVRPLISHSWSAYEVRFPSYSRTVSGGYYCLRSESLRHYLSSRYGSSLRLGLPGPSHAISATGWSEPESGAGFQKFLGQWIETDEPHGFRVPLLMDATVPQRDGFRFVYVLPVSETELLVEDTYYSDVAGFPKDYLRGSIARYLKDHGVGGYKVLDEECGALPLTFRAASGRKGAVGAAAGLAHPVTGYTLPPLLRQLEEVSALRDFSQGNVEAALDRAARRERAGSGYYYFLNRMLFRAAEKHTRRNVLERFYRLPDPLLRNFYSGRLSWLQKARVLCGKPPVPVRLALRELVQG